MQETLETWVQSLGRGDPLRKPMAPHSSTLAWRIPWTEEPGGLQRMGPQSRTQLSSFSPSLNYVLCLLINMVFTDQGQFFMS